MENPPAELKNTRFKSKFVWILLGGLLFTGVVAAAGNSQSKKIPTTTKTSQQTETKSITEKQPIPFDSQQVIDASLDTGITKVTQEGKDGEKTIVYEVVYLGSKEQSRKQLSETISLVPTPKITAKGSKVAVAPAKTTTPVPVSKAPASADAYYTNCTAARAAGVTPIYRGQPGYRSALDRDGDGVACE